MKPSSRMTEELCLSSLVDPCADGSKKRGTGPTGKMKQLFEAASRLPRSQQQKIAVLEAFVNQHATR